MRAVILASGNGTNFQMILDAINAKLLNLNIVNVISHNKDANVLKRAMDNNVSYSVKCWDKDKQTRDEYFHELKNDVSALLPDIIICVGWMLILPPFFIDEFETIINLHPALPDTFPGAHAVEDALNAYRENKINHTGCMVHYVVEKMDSGGIIEKAEVPIYNTDTVKTLKERIQKSEKQILLMALLKLYRNHTFEKNQYNQTTVYKGKVRRVSNIGYNSLALAASNRLSAFDKYVCDVPHKGLYLNAMSHWWFNQTKHIIPNHMKYTQYNTMIVDECRPFLIEVIVRGYITGSFWSAYEKGQREFWGHTLPDGMVKNTKFDKPMLTPTTKGVIDEPITAEQIVKDGYMTQEQWDYVSTKALELYTFGNKIADEMDLILVDTKYEFGVKCGDKNNKILLIDELHTCDSSRYWKKSTYNSRLEENKEPEKLDKDQVRDFIKNNPQKPIPQDLIQHVSQVYQNFYNQLLSVPYVSYEPFDMNEKSVIDIIERYYKHYHTQQIIILSGSPKDTSFVGKILKEADEHKIYTEHYICSAHKNTKQLLEHLNYYENSNLNVIWITVAGRSNALSGVVAANSRFPVIACPPHQDKLDQLVNINSSLQCPSSVPVMTVLEPSNAILCAKRMFNLQN